MCLGPASLRLPNPGPLSFSTERSGLEEGFFSPGASVCSVLAPSTAVALFAYLREWRRPVPSSKLSERSSSQKQNLNKAGGIGQELRLWPCMQPAPAPHLFL